MACHYCLPHGFPEWYRHKARLGLNDISTLLEGFRLLGFCKVRLTGGEPTIHPHCLDTVGIAKDLGYSQIAMTSNGLMIGDLEPWMKKGLTSLNLSCDSIDPEVFWNITGSKDLQKVLSLVDRAISLGLPVKINTVLMRSRNGHPAQIDEMIHWALSRPLTLRFIELMDTGLNKSFASEERVQGCEVLDTIKKMGLSPDSALSHKLADREGETAGPSTDYGFAGYPGKIGFINPLSCNFCDRCNRLRVTAKGRLKLCLFGDHDLDLDLSSPDQVAADVSRMIGLKGQRHQLERGNTGNVQTFRTIGG